MNKNFSFLTFVSANKEIFFYYAK